MITRFAFLTATLLTGASDLHSQVERVRSADFSGVAAFWRVATELQRDEEPSVSAWSELFATPGYAALEAREHRRPAITTAMRAAYRPSQRAVRDSLLAVNGWTARVIRHIQSLPSRRAELDSFAERFQENDVLGRAITRAQTLQPSGVEKTYGRPTVAFVLFLPDGRGYPGLIVADLAYVMSRPDAAPFLAHEATHFYWAHRSRERATRDSADIISTPGPDALESLLMKIAEESAGDQFDKTDAVELDSVALTMKYADEGWRNYLLEYRREYTRVPAILRAFDAALASMAREPERIQQVADSVSKALPLEGRPLGMYMARAIRAQLGDEAFAELTGDAIGYIRAYQRAAGIPACGCTPLSSAAIRAQASLRVSGLRPASGRRLDWRDGATLCIATKVGGSGVLNLINLNVSAGDWDKELA